MLKPNTIDEYIAVFPEGTQEKLQQIRAAIKEWVPGAEETISYGIPTFRLNGTYLIYFAAYKRHIGIYPVPWGNETFEKDFAGYKATGKGTIQFPLDRPLPVELVK